MSSQQLSTSKRTHLIVYGYIRIYIQKLVSIPSDIKPFISSFVGLLFKWDIVYLTSSPLVFGSDPYKALPLFDISTARNAFFNILKASKRRLSVMHKKATTSNIISLLADKCRCFHYSGHGYPNYLGLEDAKRIGETHLMHYDLIKKTHFDEDIDFGIKFVFVSGPHSRYIGQAFIDSGIGHTVAVNTKFEKTDEAASVFTKYFYERLLNGDSIQQSFENAKKDTLTAISSSQNMKTDKFLLLPENADHTLTIFGDLSPGELLDDTMKTSINNVPSAIVPFIGRCVDMRHIIHQLMEHWVNLVLLIGDTGIGKTGTAIMIARYLCDRGTFPDGIFFIDIKRLSNECSTLTEMLLNILQEVNIPFHYEPESNHHSHFSTATPAKSHMHRYKHMKHQSIVSIIRKMGNVLLIFDDIDQLDDEQDLIQSFIQNICDGCDNAKILITCHKTSNLWSKFTNDTSRYYSLRNLKPRDAAKLFSRLCNEFSLSDIMANNELMSMLECNPKQIKTIAEIKNEYNCDTLEKVVNAYRIKFNHQF